MKMTMEKTDNMLATRFGATTVATTTVGTATTSIGTKPSGYNTRTLILRIPSTSVTKYAQLPATALFVTILPPASDTSDTTDVHVHDLYHGDSERRVTYQSKSYELRFIGVKKGGTAPIGNLQP